MSGASTVPVRRPRLNPFAFPSDTTLRFVLLVIFVVCGSGRLYGYFGEDMQMDMATRECVSKVWAQISNIKTDNAWEDADKIASAYGELLSPLADCSKMLRPRVWWSVSGIFLTIMVAAIIYWRYPTRKLKAGRLERLSASDLPELEQELCDICRVANLPAPPIFVWNPIAAGLPLAFGRRNRYYVALSGAFITRFLYSDKSAFRAIIFHELAHIRNGDVSKTYLVISLWRAFITTSVAPSLLVSLWLLTRSRLSDAVSITIYAAFWTVIVVLAGLAVLRVREYYADVRASVWEEASHIDGALRALPLKVGEGWQRFLRLHPGPGKRRQIIEDPSGLFRLSYFDAFGIGVAAWSAIDTLRIMAAPFIPDDKLEAFIFFLSGEVIMPSAVLVFAAGAIGIGVWRGAFASLLNGDQPYVRTGSLGIALAAGVLPVFALGLPDVYQAHADQSTLLQSSITLLGLNLLIAIILMIACFLVFRWIADASSAWLEVSLRNRSPRPVLITTVGTAFFLVVVGLALAVYSVYLFFVVPPWRTSPESTIYGSDNFIGGPVLLASLVAWAFPLAALWWQQKGSRAGLASWVWLDGSSPRPPQQEPLRVESALVTGTIMGLTFWLLWEAEYFRRHFSFGLNDVINSAFSWLFAVTAQTFGNNSFLFPNTAMLFQALAAAIAAGRARRLNAVCGLFAASVAGSIIVLGYWVFFGFQHRTSWLLLTSLAMMGQGALAALPTVIVATSIGVGVRRVFPAVAGVRNLTEPVIAVGDPWRVTSEPRAFASRKLSGRAPFFTRFGFLEGLAATLCVVVGIGMAARLRVEVRALQQVNADQASAERGDAAAQYKLGNMYFSGTSVVQDDSQAGFWWRKAAEQGHADAEYGLANMYALGRGVPKDDGMALQWLRRAAAQGHAAAQSVLGAFYAQGRGTPRDDAAAVEWLRKSADQGYADAQNNLALMYQQGRALRKDSVVALELFRRAAEHGHADAENNLGNLYASGWGVPKDDALAFLWFRRAAEQRHAAAQGNLGLFYALGRGTARDDAAAVDWLRKSAEQGFPDAQNNLALMYQQGRALPKDDASAFQWFRRAAERGYADAENNLGNVYASGRGVPRDDALALLWFGRAAEQGHAAAQGNLGLFYALGRGTARDDAAAVEWLRKSAEQGFPDAENNLALMYQQGRALPKDDASALQWFRRAAEQGHAEAQFHIAEAYQNGNAVPKDDEEAISWFRKAAEKGYLEARDRLQAMCNTGLRVACSIN